MLRLTPKARPAVAPRRPAGQGLAPPAVAPRGSVALGCWRPAAPPPRGSLRHAGLAVASGMRSAGWGDAEEEEENVEVEVADWTEGKWGKGCSRPAVAPPRWSLGRERRAVAFSRPSAGWGDAKAEEENLRVEAADWPYVGSGGGKCEQKGGQGQSGKSGKGAAGSGKAVQNGGKGKAGEMEVGRGGSRAEDAAADVLDDSPWAREQANLDLASLGQGFASLATAADLDAPSQRVPNSNFQNHCQHRNDCCRHHCCHLSVRNQQLLFDRRHHTSHINSAITITASSSLLSAPPSKSVADATAKSAPSSS